MDRIAGLIMQMEEKMPMDIHPPVSGERKRLLTGRLKEKGFCIPDSIGELYGITNGLEIGVPGTVIESVENIEDACEIYVDPSGTRWLCIGHMSFGDRIYVNSAGEIMQLSIEEKTEFLRWNSLYEYLEDEFRNYGV